MAPKANGFVLAYGAIGVVLLWSGIKGWTISDTFRNLLSGKTPTTNEEPIDTSGGISASSGTGSSSSAKYTGTSLQQLWTSNGGAKNTAAIAAAVAEAESGGSATVTSANPDGGTNVGIFQLDTKGVGAGYTIAQLQNADLNTRITVMATRNGTNWSSWDDPVVNALPNRQYTPGAAVPGGNLDLL